jgi:hypothetical protein
MRFVARLALSLATLACTGAALVAGCGGFTGDEAQPDAAVDAPPLPDSPVVDAPVDTAPGVLDATVACPPGALLCDDFERGTLLGQWGAFVGPDAADEASTLSLDTAFSASPTRSLKAIPIAGSQAALTKALSGVGRIEIGFSLRTEAASAAQVHVLTVQFDPDVGFAQVLLKEGQLLLLEQLRPLDGGTEYFSPENAATAPVAAFERFTFVVDYNTKKFSLAHGAFVSERPLTQAHGPMTRLFLGNVFTSATSTPHWIDDVVVLTSP